MCSETAMFELDKITDHFVRREDHSHKSELTLTISPSRGTALTCNVAVTTLPVFVQFLNGGDAPLEQSIYSQRYMDTTWTVVPVNHDIAQSEWLTEYCMAFLTSEFWSGRTSVAYKTVHHERADARNTVWMSTMPAAHCNHIPGPTNLLIVLTDENTGHAVRTYNILGHDFNVYLGSRGTHPEPNRVVGTINVADHIRETFTTANYNMSAIRMTNALGWMQSHICTDMAFQIAVTIAAELSNVMFESPHIEVGADDQYSNNWVGAWTFGPHRFSEAQPYMNSSDVTMGTVKQSNSRITDMISGYNFSSVSPLCQYPAGNSRIVSALIVKDNTFGGMATQWEINTPSRVFT